MKLFCKIKTASVEVHRPVPQQLQADVRATGL